MDVLYWWKVNTKYPTLQKIAKDIIAIPVSSVASESAFSTGGRVISPHRSRLHSQTVEALMCLQNWMMEEIKHKSLTFTDLVLVLFLVGDFNLFLF